MEYRVVLSPKAIAEFDNLSPRMHIRIAAAVRDMERFPHISGIKKLKPPIGGFHKRVGDYRILFDVSGSSILIHRIKNRKDAYRV